MLDFDATDNPLHGQQEGRFLHGYYDSYCYLPLYVFCGQQLLCAYLRPSRIDGAKHAAAISRLLVTRLEYGGQGNNPRYVVTNLAGQAQALYDDLYCQRGEAENRIKEAQVGLFATRTSCQHFQGNQLRVLLAALGYVLIERLRALALQGTALACAQVDTLRIKDVANINFPESVPPVEWCGAVVPARQVLVEGDADGLEEVCGAFFACGIHALQNVYRYLQSGGGFRLRHEPFGDLDRVEDHPFAGLRHMGKQAMLNRVVF